MRSVEVDIVHGRKQWTVPASMEGTWKAFFPTIQSYYWYCPSSLPMSIVAGNDTGTGIEIFGFLEVERPLAHA